MHFLTGKRYNQEAIILKTLPVMTILKLAPLIMNVNNVVKRQIETDIVWIHFSLKLAYIRMYSYILL